MPLRSARLFSWKDFQRIALSYFVDFIRLAYKMHLTRGWFRLSCVVAYLLPESKSFRILTPDNGDLAVDFGESMCFPVISRGTGSVTESKLLKHILRQGDVVYDIGANFGLTSTVAARCIGQQGLVVAFEPSRSAFRLLLINAEGRPNIRVYGVALGDTRSISTFYTAEKVHMSSFIANELDIPVRSVEQVSVWPLDQLVADQNLPLPTVIKCDVEGAELKVFSGSHYVLSHGPIIIFEYIEKFANASGYKLQDLLDLLFSHLPSGSKLYRVDHNGEIHPGLGAYDPGSSNYLVIPPMYADRLIE